MRFSDKRQRPFLRQIQTWASVRGSASGVVWTALGRRFKDRINVPFSPAAAVRYLQDLPAPRKDLALEYIRNAPNDVMTPVRRTAIQAGLITSGVSENPIETKNADSADDGGDEGQYPCEDVDYARHNERLQRKHALGEAGKYRATAKPCPKCGRPSSELAWFYFESPKWTWDNLCGRAGWMTVCDACRAQVDFFLEVIN